jgi:hypothetical protein
MDEVDSAVIKEADEWLKKGNTPPKLGQARPQTIQTKVNGVTIEATMGELPDGTIVISDYWALP